MRIGDWSTWLSQFRRDANKAGPSLEALCRRCKQRLLERVQQEAGLRGANQSAALERDDFSSNRHPALSFCLSMISAQTLRVCREGKPVPTHRVVARGHAFPDHALAFDRWGTRNSGMAQGRTE